jgi:hypothetical protein
VSSSYGSASISPTRRSASGRRWRANSISASEASIPCAKPPRSAAARKEPGKTRERTVDTLTEKGQGALVDYARTQVAVTPLKSEPLLRLLICDLVGEEITRESMATLRGDIEDLRRRLDDAERTANQLPDRAKYLLLVVAFLRRLLDLHEELVDDVERELAAPAEQETSRPLTRGSGSLKPQPRERRGRERHS